MNEARFSNPDEPPCEAPNTGVTYAIKVLGRAGDAGDGIKRVLFSRIAEDEVIEIRMETDADNLFEKLPELLDAALEIQRSRWAPQRTVALLPSDAFLRLAEESQRVRWLTLGANAAEAASAVDGLASLQTHAPGLAVANGLGEIRG